LEVHFVAEFKPNLRIEKSAYKKLTLVSIYLIHLIGRITRGKEATRKTKM
jgi:hypothetical protein